MSLKTKLVEKFGKKEAEKILSEHGKSMRAKVKNPYYNFNDSGRAREAANKRWNGAKNLPKEA